MASAMEAYAEYFTVLDKFKKEEEKEALRQEMLRLQSRLPVNQILFRKTA